VREKPGKKRFLETKLIAGNEHKKKDQLFSGEKKAVPIAREKTGMAGQKPRIGWPGAEQKFRKVERKKR